MGDDVRSQDLVTLQTRVLQLRACLYDPETGLPTLPVVLDQTRRMLDERGVLQLLLVRIEQEQHLERVVGWERYDSLLRALASRLREVLAVEGGPRWLLCHEHVRGDSFIVIQSEPKATDRVVAALGRGLDVVDADTGEADPRQVRIGRGVVRRQPALRTERSIYAGLVEARRDFARQGRVLDQARKRDLRTILESKSVTTLFQPIVKLSDGDVIGFEALSRGPRSGYLEQAEKLFGFAERCGLVGELEQLCIDRALTAATRLPPGATLFLNLSVVGIEHLETRGDGLAALVERRGWSPERCVLEVTERTYADDPQRLRQMVDLLRRHGFRVAIDDMGTGYSSLNVLADLKPDYIKLDQMLVRDLASEPIKQNLVTALVGFATTSRSLVIAEGVERQDEAEVLERLGIDLVQGFLFGVPEAR